MFSGLFVVLFVEASNKFLKYRSHPVIVQTRVLYRSVAVKDRIGTQIHIRRKKPLDECP